MIISISEELMDRIVVPELLGLDGFRYCDVKLGKEFPIRVGGRGSIGDEIHGRVIHGIWQEKVVISFRKDERQPTLTIVTGQTIGCIFTRNPLL